MRHYLILLALLIMWQIASAEEFPIHTSYSVCFTPGGDCTGNIISAIDAAKQVIYVQAYSLTAKPIVKALTRAKQRGVKVQVILDAKTSQADIYHRRSLNYLQQNHVPVWLDSQVNIAHNKVIIIDNSIVVTGSFNFTWSAQRVNAENVLIIHDHGLALAYLKNWRNRLAQSKSID